MRVRGVIVLCSVLLVAGCSSDSESDSTLSETLPTLVGEPGTTTADTQAAVTLPDTVPVTTDVDPVELLDTRGVVEALAADELEGRDNLSEGSLAAQRLLIDQLALFAQPAYPEFTGDDGYLQPFDTGVNVLAVIPGGELAEEYVVLGAHYDGLGSDCRQTVAGDNVCNGATDNAAGVAVVMAVAQTIAAEGLPRRSVIIALWDSEEDGLAGSAAYALDPLVPADQVVAYLNFDIQGADLLPSLTNATLALGGETGGEPLVQALAGAVAQSTLDTVLFSVIYGQGRSDHVNFLSEGIPSVFFTDATSACYHTVEDDVSAMNFPKLDQQIVTATALTRTLVSTDDVPVFVADAPLTTYADAVQMLGLVTTAQPDFGRWGPEVEAANIQFVADLQAIVDAGPDAFGEAAVGVLLNGAVALVDTLTEGDCATIGPGA